MADDAELAFLSAQQEYDPAANFAAADEEDYDPATAYAPSDHSAPMPESAVNTPPPAADGEGEDESEYLPEPAPVSAEVSAAPTPSKQLRTRGGFVDESEDEEEEPVEQPKMAAAGLLRVSEIAESPQRSFTSTPTNSVTSPVVHLHSAQDQGAPSLLSASVAVNESAPSIASTVLNGGTPVPDDTKPGAPDAANAVPEPQPAAPVSSVPASAAALPKTRLPQDRIGILEDRIAEDPRGDIDAWISLIDEHRRRHKHDDARAVFDRFLTTFPTAGEQWVEYIAFETQLDELSKVELLFSKAVPLAPYVQLYSSYIDFIRRRYNLTTDQSGQNRQIVTAAYEFVLDQVGIDVTAGKLWIDYIEMLKTGPGVLGGTSWQDMQKMDTLRKVYQRAVSIPHSATLEIWREYDKFEMGFNKTTGRKQLQEKSPSYMTARGAINVLDNNVMRGVQRTTYPRLPPAAGFDGHDDYMTQVQLWKRWIQWEKSDPIDVATDDRSLYSKRVLHVYKNALMALRFWPDLWYEAAEWCYENSLTTEGDKFLDDGIVANPESCLLAFKKANQVELRTDFEDGQPGIIAKGTAVREPYIKLLDTIYDLTAQTKKREEHSIARAREAFEAQKKADETARALADRNGNGVDDEDDDETSRRLQQKEATFNTQLQAMSAGYNAQTHVLKKTLTYAWIALMRAMRRVQGKGSPGADIGGFRGVFAEARKKGKLLSEAYVASALIEHHCYQDPAANKIFERGMKLFPEDEHFAMEYIKHLIKLNDSTNARAVFETVVGKITSKPENVQRAKSLFLFFHDYESQFGELAQITKLEQRMATLYPGDPQLQCFSQRFAGPTFDPTATRPIISPRTQMKPVMPSMPAVTNSVDDHHHAGPPQMEQRLVSPPLLNSPRLGNLLPSANMNSPKRPLEDGDDGNQPRKLARGESPALKGAAGRRLDAVRRNQVTTGATPAAQGPARLALGINFLLSVMPSAQVYCNSGTQIFNPSVLVDIIRANNRIPMPSEQQPPAPVRWGTTPTTAQQLASIQEKYGNQNGGHAHTPSWG